VTSCPRGSNPQGAASGIRPTVNIAIRPQVCRLTHYTILPIHLNAQFIKRITNIALMSKLYHPGLTLAHCRVHPFFFGRGLHPAHPPDRKAGPKTVVKHCRKALGQSEPGHFIPWPRTTRGAGHVHEVLHRRRPGEVPQILKISLSQNVIFKIRYFSTARNQRILSSGFLPVSRPDQLVDILISFTRSPDFRIQSATRRPVMNFRCLIATVTRRLFAGPFPHSVGS
jgi:hypothetical protein